MPRTPARSIPATRSPSTRARTFTEAWREALECCATPDTRHAVFHDRLQDMYGREAIGGIADFPVFKLEVNCRNTRSIAEHRGKIISNEIATGRRSPPGAPVSSFGEAGLVDGRDAVISTLGTWLVGERLDPRPIAVVSPYRQDNPKCCLRGVHEVHGTRIVTDHEAWARGNGVLFETTHSFEGLEADLVALVDVPASSRVFGPAHLCVASSRARMVLHVFAVASWSAE